jgi:hypothetical protein
MKELRVEGVQTRDIAEALKRGIIEKVKPGLYKLIDYPWDEHSSFADVRNERQNNPLLAHKTGRRSIDFQLLYKFVGGQKYSPVKMN